MSRALLLTWTCAVVSMVTSLNPNLPFFETPPPDEPSDGYCQCTVYGDPMVGLYDGQAAYMVLGDDDAYLVSFVMFDTSLYECSFVLIVKTQRQEGFKVPEALLIILNGGPIKGASTTFITKQGIWNNAVPDQWVTESQYTNTSLPWYIESVTPTTGGTQFTMKPNNEDCQVKFRVVIGGLQSQVSIMANQTMYGNHMMGICGDCNDIQDDYPGNQNDIMGPINKAKVSKYNEPLNVPVRSS